LTTTKKKIWQFCKNGEDDDENRHIFAVEMKTSTKNDETDVVL